MAYCAEATRKLLLEEDSADADDTVARLRHDDECEVGIVAAPERLKRPLVLLLGEVGRRSQDAEY